MTTRRIFHEKQDKVQPDQCLSRTRENWKAKIEKKASLFDQERITSAAQKKLQEKNNRPKKSPRLVSWSLFHLQVWL